MSYFEYIPDKKMYAAVIGACKYIRDTGFFNKAVRYYSDKYGVNEDELKNHIMKRSKAGRKAKGKTTYKFKYYIVETCTQSEATPEPFKEYKVLKGTKARNVEDRCNELDEKFSKRNDNGSVYSIYRYSSVIKEFENKDDAIKYCEKMYDEQMVKEVEKDMLKNPKEYENGMTFEDFINENSNIK